MAFDTARARAVIFGGFAGGGAFVGETWEWDGSSWSLAATTGPSPRVEHDMVYDEARGRMVLFSGRSPTQYFGDTWELVGSNWVEVKPQNSPSARWRTHVVYDAARKRITLFGGTAKLEGLDAYLEELYVVPARRGKGSGRALLDAAIDAAREAGAEHIDLATGETDTAARGLYESAGFSNREGSADGPSMLYYERRL